MLLRSVVAKLFQAAGTLAIPRRVALSYRTCDIDFSHTSRPKPSVQSARRQPERWSNSLAVAAYTRGIEVTAQNAVRLQTNDVDGRLEMSSPRRSTAVDTGFSAFVSGKSSSDITVCNTLYMAVGIHPYSRWKPTLLLCTTPGCRILSKICYKTWCHAQPRNNSIASRLVLKIIRIAFTV